MIPPWYARLYHGWCGAEPVEFELPKTIRINTLKANSEEVCSFFAEQGVRLEKIPYLSSGYTIRDDPFNVVTSSIYLRGGIYIQDAASQFAAEALQVSPGDLVLDVCASPGGKASHLAGQMHNTGSLICLEAKTVRIPKLKYNLERLGVSCATVYATDAALFDADLCFDRILLDAPCSGNYVADPAWFEKRIDLALCDESLAGIIEEQKVLLNRASALLKNGGKLLYCTCSLNPEEDEKVVLWALETLPLRLISLPRPQGSPAVSGMTHFKDAADAEELEKTLRFWPHLSKTQGFFLALFEKKATVE